MKRALVAVALLILVLCVLFVIGQTNQVVNLASTLDPVLGRVVLGVLLSIYALCGLGPVVLFFRLPRRLEAPAGTDDAGSRRHLVAVARRLARNRHLAGRLITANRDSIDQALACLRTKAKERIATAATMVCIGTALVRSGRLEGVMLLVTHTRMIWQIAHVHWQRPTLRDMIWLYSNAGATILAAQALEDMDPTDIPSRSLRPSWADRRWRSCPGSGRSPDFSPTASWRARSTPS